MMTTRTATRAGRKRLPLPECSFTVECGGEKSAESGQLDVRGGLKVIVKDVQSNSPFGNVKISFWNEERKFREFITNGNGYFELLDIPIEKFEIKLENK